MGMSKDQLASFLPILFATLSICAIVLCTCAYCYRPAYFARRIHGARDLEKAPDGSVIIAEEETASDVPVAVYVEAGPDAEEVEVVDANPETDSTVEEPEAEVVEVVEATPGPAGRSRLGIW